MSDDPFLDSFGADPKPAAAPRPRPAPARAPSPDRPTRATRNNNPGNIEDGPFARKQPGYIGGDGRFARFDTPENGRNAQMSLLGSYQGRGINTPAAIASRWAPPHENNTGNYAQTIARTVGVGINEPIPPTKLHLVAAAQDGLEGYGGPGVQIPDDPNNPFLQALNGGNAPPDAPRPPNRTGDSAGNQSGDSAGSVNPLPGGRVHEGSSGGYLRSFGQFSADVGIGALEGLEHAVDGIVVGIPTKLSDLVGLTDHAHDRYLQRRAELDKSNDPLFNTQDGWGRSVGNFGGEFAATLPVSEIKILQGLTKGGKLGQTLARYGDYALQGGMGGVLFSGGDNTAKMAGEGMLLGPLAGAVGEHVVGPAAGWLVGRAKGLSNALKERLSRMGAEATPAVAGPSVMPLEVQKGITDMIDAGKSADEIMAAYPGWADRGRNPGAIKEWVRLRQAGDNRPVEFTARPNEKPTASGVNDVAQPPEGVGTEEIVVAAPRTAPREHMAAAIGNRSAKSGIEATTDLPPAVAEHRARLLDQNVEPGEALREADIIGIGAKPTVAAVKRTPEDMHALYEGAKVNTPEGRALSQQIADNNAAIHNRVQSLVNDLGGVPSQGEAAQTAAEALARRADEAKANVSRLYEEARAQDGDQRVSIDALRELLASTPYKAATTAEGKQLVNGLRAQIKAMEAQNGGRFSPEEIDQLTKAANAAYNPMGGGANNMIGEIKGALSESLDQFNKAGPAFKAARAAHADYATRYDDPAGVAGLIRRDAKGNFLNEDNWRSAEGLIGTASDKKFVQIANQLKQDGEQAAIDRLKAAIVQRTYERATNSAADRMGNATLNGKLWFTELNKIGMAKLKAVFSPAEIADLAHVGRAAIHMNEAIPGTANTSNTASTVINWIEKQGKGFTHPKLKLAGHVLGQGVGLVSNTTIPGAGNAAAAALTASASKGADALANRSAASALAKALREQMSPEAARLAENAQAKRLAEALTRKKMSRRAAQQISRAAGAEENSRSQ